MAVFEDSLRKQGALLLFRNKAALSEDENMVALCWLERIDPCLPIMMTFAHQMVGNHIRSINTEEKAKVVAAGWGTNLNAALTH